MATNIPLGTYVTDGVRTGPIYTGPIPKSLYPLNTTSESLSYSSYGRWGQGIMLSPITTWSLTPYPSTNGNVVATTADGAVPAAAYLTLRGDNAATKAFGNPVTLVQFDWPRVVQATIAGAAATAGTRVTVFGIDWYGFPMQHTYLVQAQASYPIAEINADGTQTLDEPAKAFYAVTGVYVDRGLPAGCTISLQTMDVLGLPFAIRSGDTVSIGWGASSDLTGQGPAAYAAASPLIPIGVFGAAAEAATNATSGDVRGYYGPSSPADGVKELRFTYYVHGANQFTNQEANEQANLQLAQPAIPVVGVPVVPLTAQNLYGQVQFYTGSPS